MSPRHFALSLALAAASLPAAVLRAQAPAAPPARDTLRLGALQDEAVRRDPRARQLDLLASQSALRLRSLGTERLPTLGVNALGQYQSDVPAIPFQLPGGATPAAPPHDVYDASLSARQRLYDPTLAPRRGVERAQLAESQARVRSTLYALRQSVNDAYFSALLLEAQGAELETAITDLEARRRDAAERVQGGAALPSESATLEAELLRRRQSLAELAASRDAALVVLGSLTGRTVTAADTLELPDLAADVARAREALGELRERPEYEQFARSRELLASREAAAAAQDRPRVSAFGRAGYGRPGLNPLGREFDEYWLAGVQVEWTPWSWGATRREREVLALQRQIVATEEAAFTEAVRRGVAGDLAAIGRLERTLAADDTIIALRERILRETRLRFTEGVVTSAEYVDRETDLLDARLARATHRVELARARARFLTLVGIEVR
ncbi:MAG TPA: TolC family protein [Gemmatimonadaceae bacterium]|nr:TolC family protein [Gemmatimonadaceae bacterium]